ncbi:MAG: YvcK family protein [Anaerolineales bacterium]|nr:YvcK family protein [Anaerolineales bacterium]MDW8161783.1 YvcK family protein [Anaerolineales bacterium]
MSKPISGLGKLCRDLTQAFRWLSPGIGVKRWLVLTLMGTTLIGIGLGIVILHIYRTAPETWWLPLLSAASLRFLSRPLRALIFILLGLGMVLGGILGINRALMQPFVKPGKKVVDELTIHRKRERGIKVVAIGGGHGLATLLRGLKEYTYNLTAIVTVADSGGSSGRLRKEMGILPPGDLRNCLAALSNDEALLTHLFQYRFPDGQGGLNGHSLGNLLITALAEITGSFEEAIAESGRVLAVRGRVLPSTLQQVDLVADVRLPLLTADMRIEGESEIPSRLWQVKRVYLQPNSPPAYPEAIRAILAADLIVIGPGSLYTSILPNLLVPEITEAIRSSKALKIYVCNIATQPGETDHYSCEDHVHAIETHVGKGLFQIVLANLPPEDQLKDTIEWVRISGSRLPDYQVFKEKLYDDTHLARHRSDWLARSLISIYQWWRG